MDSINHARTAEELVAGLPDIRRSPRDNGTLRAIVIRPAREQRVMPSSCELSVHGGTEGDHWAKGCWLSLPDGRPHPHAQIKIGRAHV